MNMWNRISGKSDEATVLPSKNSTRRSSGEEKGTTRTRSGSVISIESKKTSSSRRSDEPSRGLNPTSTSFSSTSRTVYQGVAAPSVAYAPASGNGKYVSPGLVRSSSLADKMVKSGSSRDIDGFRDGSGRKDGRKSGRRSERSTSRDIDNGLNDFGERRERDDIDEQMDRRNRKDKRRKDSGSSKHGSETRGQGGTSRGPEAFSSQIESNNFVQFPGQDVASVPGPFPVSQQHEPMSSHIQDQFPGQFSTESSIPYRPPVTAAEGGPGLAAEYYGDTGESVAHQPGFRKHSPSLIIGAEPHLQPASSTPAPPPEPSQSGLTGAAASFYSGEFEESASTNNRPNSSVQASAPSRPSGKYHSSSAPTIPTLSGGAVGAATGYMMSGGLSSQEQIAEHVPPISGHAGSVAASTTNQTSLSNGQDSYYTSSVRPPKPGKSSSQSSNVPLYAAGAAAVTGLAAAAYSHNHHETAQHNSTAQDYSATPMRHRYRHRGPLSAFVEFFKDPEAVAQYEEYTEFTGVCRGCFEPGSSPMDAPRKHRYYKKRSKEKLGATTRIEKQYRYSSSDDESRRGKSSSWFGAGLAGYGLGKVGETLFNQRNDFDETDEVKSGRFSPVGKSQLTRESLEKRPRRRNSDERVETGITNNGKIYKKGPHDRTGADPTTAPYPLYRQSTSGSRSRDHKDNHSRVAIGATTGSSITTSGYRPQSQSPKQTFSRSERTSREGSLLRHRTHKKKREKGFFSFLSPSSSSSNLDLDLRSHKNKQNKQNKRRKSTDRIKNNREAEAALLGLGAATAALALKDGRSNGKTSKEMMSAKESIGKPRQRSNHERLKHSSASSGEVWESASEGAFSNIDPDLAFGSPSHRSSRESLTSQSSGTDKWDWRWGSRDKRPESARRRDSRGSNVQNATILDGSTMMSPDHFKPPSTDSPSHVALQYVHPVQTSDPGWFDVQREEPTMSALQPVVISPPEAVPIQQPQPIAPVSSSFYTSRAPIPRPDEAPIFSRPSYPPQSDDVRVASITSVPQISPRHVSVTDETLRDVKLQRRGTSPARLGEDTVSSSINPQRSHSAKDDSAMVRFAISEEQEEKERKERHRRKKEEVLAETRKTSRRRGSGERPDKERDAVGKTETKDEAHNNTSWAAPASKVAGAVIGAAVIADESKKEETREERRERRRREREREDEEDASARSERRRTKERERAYEDRSSKDCRRYTPEEEATTRRGQDLEDDTTAPRKSVWQEAGTPRQTTHEDYQSFFTPIEVLNKNNVEAKVTSAEPDADINFVEIIPKTRRPDEPEFSIADTDEKVDLSGVSLSWPVPHLRLVQPTPPTSRVSTPSLKPDEPNQKDVEDDKNIDFSSNVPRRDDRTPQRTDVIALEHTDNSIEPLSEDIRQQKRALDLSDSEPEDQNHPAVIENIKPKSNGLRSNEFSSSYGNDYEFAATLAASAQDAGFDPSIVIDDPTYRRRDSPPGSNDRAMPGPFDNDEDQPRRSKKEKRTRDKAARSEQSSEASEERNHSAIVQDIISQVEQSGTLENADGDFVSRSPESPGDAGESAKRPEDDYSVGDVRDIENDASITPSRENVSPIIIGELANDQESSKESHQKSEQQATGFNNTSMVPPAANGDVPTEKKSKARKGSLWDRVLGKSTDGQPHGNVAKDQISGPSIEDLDKLNNKSGIMEDHETLPDLDGDAILTASHPSKPSDEANEHRDGETSKSRNTGRRTQDQMAKSGDFPNDNHSLKLDLEARPLETIGSEPEHNLDRPSESFLGMRPEPPPPPDIVARHEEPPSPLNREDGTSPERRQQHPSEIVIAESQQSPRGAPSPTAVPVHFKRPRPTNESRRSASQSSSSPTKFAAEVLPKTKPRPRSTEFKSSKEIRPLWLVERHQSHQEPSPGDTYPPLPDSDSNSAASSVNDPEEVRTELVDEQQMVEQNYDPRDLAKAMYEGSLADALSSQHATPTATSIETHVDRVRSPSPSNRESSISSTRDVDTTSRAMHQNDVVAGVLVGGATTFVLSKASHHDGLINGEPPTAEAHQLKAAQKEMAPSTASAELQIGQPGNFSETKADQSEKQELKAFSRRPTQAESSQQPRSIDQEYLSINDPAEGDHHTTMKNAPVFTSLSKTMSRDEVVHMMAADAESQDNMMQAPVQTKNLDGIEPKPSSTPAKSHAFVGPFVSDEKLGPSQASQAADVESKSVDTESIESSLVRDLSELSPLTIPLPEGDDSDLLAKSCEAGPLGFEGPQNGHDTSGGLDYHSGPTQGHFERPDVEVTAENEATETLKGLFEDDAPAFTGETKGEKNGKLKLNVEHGPSAVLLTQNHKQGETLIETPSAESNRVKDTASDSARNPSMNSKEDWIVPLSRKKGKVVKKQNTMDSKSSPEDRMPAFSRGASAEVRSEIVPKAPSTSPGPQGSASKHLFPNNHENSPGKALPITDASIPLACDDPLATEERGKIPDNALNPIDEPRANPETDGKPKNQNDLSLVVAKEKEHWKNSEEAIALLSDKPIENSICDEPTPKAPKSDVVGTTNVTALNSDQPSEGDSNRSTCEDRLSHEPGQYVPGDTNEIEQVNILRHGQAEEPTVASGEMLNASDLRPYESKIIEPSIEFETEARPRALAISVAPPKNKKDKKKSKKAKSLKPESTDTSTPDHEMLLLNDTVSTPLPFNGDVSSASNEGQSQVAGSRSDQEIELADDDFISSNNETQSLKAPDHDSKENEKGVFSDDPRYVGQMASTNSPAPQELERSQAIAEETPSLALNQKVEVAEEDWAPMATKRDKKKKRKNKGNFELNPEQNDELPDSKDEPTTLKGAVKTDPNYVDCLEPSITGLPDMDYSVTNETEYGSVKRREEKKKKGSKIKSSASEVYSRDNEDEKKLDHDFNDASAAVSAMPAESSPNKPLGKADLDASREPEIRDGTTSAKNRKEKKKGRKAKIFAHNEGDAPQTGYDMSENKEEMPVELETPLEVNQLGPGSTSIRTDSLQAAEPAEDDFLTPKSKKEKKKAKKLKAYTIDVDESIGPQVEPVQQIIPNTVQDEDSHDQDKCEPTPFGEAQAPLQESNSDMNETPISRTFKKKKDRQKSKKPKLVSWDEEQGSATMEKAADSIREDLASEEAMERRDTEITDDVNDSSGKEVVAREQPGEGQHVVLNDKVPAQTSSHGGGVSTSPGSLGATINAPHDIDDGASLEENLHADDGANFSTDNVTRISEGPRELAQDKNKTSPQDQDFEIERKAEANDDAVLSSSPEEIKKDIPRNKEAKPSNSETQSTHDEPPGSNNTGHLGEHLISDSPHLEDEDATPVMRDSASLSTIDRLVEPVHEVRPQTTDELGTKSVEETDRGQALLVGTENPNVETLSQFVGVTGAELPKQYDHIPRKDVKDEDVPLSETTEVNNDEENQEGDEISQSMAREDGESVQAQMETITEDAVVSQAAETGEIKPADLLRDGPIKRIEKSRNYNKPVTIMSEELDIFEEPKSRTTEQVETTPSDTPLSVGSIDLLDAEGQREYDEKYARELQRLLESDVNETAIDVQHSELIHSTANTSADPSAQETRETLVNATPLEDIFEEPRSVSGSIQNIVTTVEDDFPSFKSTKKSKKGRKGKKEEQPIIWEDDTATPAIIQGEKSSLSEPGAKDRPHEREEHIDSDHFHETLPESPVIGSPSLRRMSTRADDENADYFGVEPSQRAEVYIKNTENGGRERSISQGTLDLSQDHVPEVSMLDRQNDIEGEKPYDDIGDILSVKKTKKGKKSKRKDFEQDAKTSASNEREAKRSYHQELDEDDLRDPSSVSQDLSPHRQDIIDANESNAAVALGTAAIGTESRISKKDKKRDKKYVKSTTMAQDEKPTHEASKVPFQQTVPVQEPSRQSAPRSNDGQFLSSARQSPSRSYVEQSEMRESRLDIRERDSAVHFTDSPVVPDLEPAHRAGRDSGYPDSETVLLADGRESAQGEVTERGLIDAYVDEPKRESILTERGIIDSYQDKRPDGGASPSSGQAKQGVSPDRAPLQVSTDMDQEHNVSTPEQKYMGRRQRRASGAAYDSDDSADSGFDIQRRRRRLQSLAEEYREPSPISSTTKDRSSALFDSSPSGRCDVVEQPQDQEKSAIHSTHEVVEPQQLPQEQEKVHLDPSWSFANVGEESQRSLFGGPVHKETLSSRSRSPQSSDNRGRQAMRRISERSVEQSPQSPLRTTDTLQPSDSSFPSEAVQATKMLGDGEDSKAIGIERSVSRNTDRVPSRQSNGSTVPSVQRNLRSPIAGSPDSIRAIIRTPDQVRSASGQSFRSSGTPPLRRVDRSASGDLRAASRKSEAKIGASPKISEEAESESESASVGQPESNIPFATSSSYDPLTDKGKGRADPDMADYEGWGDVRGQSPMSPTRPPSMRKRQSMHFAEMEQRLAMLASENSLLQNAKLKAEKRLEEQANDHSQQRQSYDDAIRDHKAYIAERDSTLNELNNVLDGLRQQVAHLTEANEELMQSREIGGEGIHHNSEQTSRELEELRVRHTQLATDHQDIVSREVDAIRGEKEDELRRLRDELESAKEQVRKLQQQILASRSTEDIVERDEDYFDAQCQELCKHLTSWVTRFSKLSDNKRCYLAGEIRNEAHREIYEDSMLDGSEVDDYLQDRHKRRDVFMSVTMTLIFKHVFARYLFGMDREHRQKLKTLDKTLQEVGPPSAVHKWRATTLTLLSKRPAFQSQRDTDSEAVVNDIWATLSSALPPPSTSAQTAQCRESLRRIVNLAVNLSIDMRLQRAEYSMLPPPEPDFDPQTGDIKNRLYFTAASMNERSGAATSNEELEDQGAWLRMVLFPLVVKNTDEEDQTQIVVFPASVHVAPLKKGKTVRVMSAQGERSEASYDAGAEDTVMEGGMF